MTFIFQDIFTMGTNDIPSPIQMFKSFVIGGAVNEPTWQDIVISGVGALTLVNAKANSLEYLKLFGKTINQSILPSGYTQYTYLRNSQYATLDTGFIPTVDDIVLDIRCFCWGAATFYIWQSCDRPGGNILGIGGETTGATINLYGGDGTIAVTSGISRTSGHTYHIVATLKNGNATLYVRDETAGVEDTQTGTYTFTANATGFAFFWNKNNNSASGYRIMTAKCWYQGELVQNWIPAEAPNGNRGMYNVVDSTFITSSASWGVGDVVTSPTADSCMNIVCNNGTLKYGQYGKNLFDKNQEFVSGYIDDNGDLVNFARLKTTVGYIKVSPNTTYTISYLAIKENTSNMSISLWTENNVFISREARANISQTGARSSSFTTTATTAKLRVTIWTDDTTYEDFQLEQGSMATTYEPYHFGLYTNGTIETVAIRSSVNLSNITYSTDTFINASGVESANIGMSASSLIPVTPNTNYIWSATTGAPTRGRRIHEYDSNGDWIRQISTFTPSTSNVQTDYSKDFTTGATAAYIRISTAMDESNRVLMYTSDTATATDLYGYRTYADVQEVITGAINRQMHAMALTGDETYTPSPTSGIKRYIVDIDENYLALADGKSIRGSVLATHFNSIHSSTSQTLGGAFTYNKTKLYMIPFDQTISTADDFAAWVKSQYQMGFPVIFVYPLYTETTESTTGQNVNINAGTNTIEITQASLTGLSLEAKYLGGVTVTVEEVENANLDNQVTVTIT